MQLTNEQERKLETVVKAGAYASTDEALDAAITAVSAASAIQFEGGPELLSELLLKGLASKSLSEEEFWDSVAAETDGLLRGGDRPA